MKPKADTRHQWHIFIQPSHIHITVYLIKNVMKLKLNKQNKNKYNTQGADCSIWRAISAKKSENGKEREKQSTKRYRLPQLG